MRCDAQKVFNLLKSSDSRSVTNFCDLIRLCANLGEIKLIEEIITYTKNKTVILPQDEITELVLFSYFHNGELDKALEIGYLILKKNDQISSQISQNNNNQNMVNEEIYDDEFHGHERKIKRIEYLVLKEQIENLIEKPFFPSKNFYTILFAVCGSLGRPSDCLELYEYLEREKKNFEIKSQNENEKSQKIKLSTSQIKERKEENLIQENFYHNIEYFVIESFLKRNQFDDAQYWALQAIKDKLKRKAQNRHLHQLNVEDKNYTKYDHSSNNKNNNNDNNSDNNSHSKTTDINESHNNIDEQESYELLIPILRFYLKNGQIDEMKNLLTECNELDRSTGLKLNHAFLLRMSAEGNMSEVMEILTLNNLDANLRLKDKLLLWEASLLGCLYGSYDTLVENEKKFNENEVDKYRSHNYTENDNNDRNDKNSNNNYSNSSNSSYSSHDDEGDGQNLGSRSPTQRNKRLSPAFKAEQVTTLFYFILFSFILFYFILLLYFILYHSILIYSILFYSTLFFSSFAFPSYPQSSLFFFSPRFLCFPSSFLHFSLFLLLFFLTSHLFSILFLPFPSFFFPQQL